MLSVTAPPGKRAPVDLFVWLDVDPFCKLPAYWHQLLMKAMELIMEKLDDNDNLQIFPVHLEWLEMTTEGKRVAAAAIRSKEIHGRRQLWSVNLEYAIRVFRGEARDPLSRMSAVIVISNGNVDMGEIEEIDLHQMPWNSDFIPSKYFGPRANFGVMLPDSRRHAFVGVPSSDKDPMDYYPPGESMRCVCMHTFGMRCADNAKELYTLAFTHGGVYAVLDDENGQVTEAFATCIDRLTSVVDHIWFNSQWINERISRKVHRGATSNYVMYVDKDMQEQLLAGAGAGALRLHKLLGTRINWARGPETTFTRTHVLRKGDNKMVSVQVESVMGPETMLSMRTHVVRKGDHVSKVVAAEMVKVEAVKIVLGLMKLTSMAGWKELNAAADMLCETWGAVQRSDYAKEAGSAGLISRLATEMLEIEARLRFNNSWQEYILSWERHQTLQLPVPVPPQKLVGDIRPNVMLIHQPTINLTTTSEPVAKPQGVPMLLRLVAPEASGTMEPDVARIDLVVVLNVAYGSLKPTQRPGLLKEALQLIMGKLHDKDRLAVIAVHSSDTQPTGFVEPAECSDILAKLESLLAAPATSTTTTAQASHGRERLKKAIGKFLRDSHCLPIVPGSQQAGTSSTTHVHADSGNTSLQKALTDAVKSHNAMALYSIASSTGGIYATLNNDKDQISESFVACINRITSIVASQTQVDIKCSDSSAVTLLTIESGKLSSGISRDRKLGHIRVGNIHYGAARNFIVYLDNNIPDHEYEGFPVILTARVRYMVAGWMNMKQNHVHMLAKEDDPILHAEFTAEMIRAKAVEMVSEIAHKYDGSGLIAPYDKEWKYDALGDLHVEWVRLKESESAQAADDARLTVLGMEIRQIQRSLESGSGVPDMLSWLSFQNIREQLPSKPEESRNEDSSHEEERRPGLPLWELPQGPREHNG
ncbi:hypothetical protein EJB05_02531 [Eragrostis curvula]|uniref:VWFA domain-containing protein n=1 Tax=Eragrostis curvula TaxID=38414 RepID=A0A5J9WVD7_9POAL|nr:hypothetical protein EJB05_02531 [Eragrostis curvula]